MSEIKFFRSQGEFIVYRCMKSDEEHELDLKIADCLEECISTLNNDVIDELFEIVSNISCIDDQKEIRKNLSEKFNLLDDKTIEEPSKDCPERGFSGGKHASKKQKTS